MLLLTLLVTAALSPRAALFAGTGLVLAAYARLFLRRFIRFGLTCPLPAAATALLYVVVFGLAGQTFGLASLFWHDNAFVMAVAAGSATVLLALVGFVGFYADRQRLLHPEDLGVFQEIVAFLDLDPGEAAELVRRLKMTAGRDSEGPPLCVPTARGVETWGPVRAAKWVPVACARRILRVGGPMGVSGRRRLGAFLCVAGFPALLLLLAPALLPEAFGYLPRSTPREPDWLFSGAGPAPTTARQAALVGGPTSGETPPGEPHAQRFTRLAFWSAGVAIGVAVSALLVVASSKVRRGLLRAATALRPRRPQGPLPGGVPRDDESLRLKEWQFSYVALLLMVLALYLLLNLASLASQRVPSACSVCALLGIVVMLGAPFPARERNVAEIQVLAALLFAGCLVCANRDAYKMSFLNMDGYYAQPLNIAGKTPGGVVNLYRVGDASASVKVYDPAQDQFVLPPTSDEAAEANKVGAEVLAQSNGPAATGAQPGAGVEAYRTQGGRFSVHAAGTDKAVLVPPREALERWRARFAGKPKLAVVVVSGGALRAAYWTATVLKRIEETFRRRCLPEFRDNVRLIAGASGGMLGAAYYVADVPEVRRRFNLGDMKGLPDAIPRDSLSGVAGHAALREPFWAFWPWRQPYDRGQALEDSWGELGRIPFNALRCLERDGRVPSLVFSPMQVEDGRQLLISNLDLSYLTQPEASLISYDDERPGAKVRPLSRTRLQFFGLFPYATGFRLSTAVRMNATFPLISPAVYLPTDPPRRLVDAGYYDNYGVQVAAGWLGEQRDWLLENTSGVVLVQIRAFPTDGTRWKVDPESPDWFAQLPRGFQLVTSPVEAVLSARTSVSTFLDDDDVGHLNAMFNRSRQADTPIRIALADLVAGKMPPGFFTTVTFECVADVSMNWSISRYEVERLQDLIPLASDAGTDQMLKKVDHLTRVREAGETDAAYQGRIAAADRWCNYLRLQKLADWWSR